MLAMQSTVAWQRHSKGFAFMKKEAGVDWVQFEAPHSIDEIKRARKVVRGPFSAMKRPIAQSPDVRRA